MRSSLATRPVPALARGILTAKYDPYAPPPADTRAGRQDKRQMQTEWRPESLRLARTIAQHAEAHGSTPSRFAIAWVLNNRIVTGIIGGPRTEVQWEDYLAAIGTPFTAEDEAPLESLVAPGHSSIPGYNDPAYPIEGRPTRTS
jgi:aryl-alcohol dehydrogenase-like predicted oxidoreductase